MATTFISSNSTSTTLRISAMKSQAELSRATKEATTGRLADVGLSLGALSGRDVVLRAELVDVDKLVDTQWAGVRSARRRAAAGRRIDRHR
jgi:flagellar hook-associated protein 3 FlgL